MRIIAHPGNINGPSEDENSIEQITTCLDLGYDVEIDVRYDPLTSVFWLGHDEPEYKISWKWLANRHERLWIHCKNIRTLYEFAQRASSEYQYFWHQEDDFTLTSGNIIWTYPGKPYTPRSVVVMPELNMEITNMSDLKGLDCYGICTDYPSMIY